MWCNAFTFYVNIISFQVGSVPKIEYYLIDNKTTTLAYSKMMFTISLRNCECSKALAIEPFFILAPQQQQKKIASTRNEEQKVWLSFQVCSVFGFVSNQSQSLSKLYRTVNQNTTVKTNLMNRLFVRDRARPNFLF